MAEIAINLNVTERTLHHRLEEEEEGTNYRDLLKRIKTELAASYLRKNDFSTQDIVPPCFKGIINV